MAKETAKHSYKFAMTDSGQLLTVTRDDGVWRQYDVSKLNPEMRGFTIGHGIKQKLTDDTMENKLDGADRFAAMDDLWARLIAPDATVDGSWDKEREGTKRFGEALIALIMRLTKQDRSEALASLKAASPEKIEAIKIKFAADLVNIAKTIAEAQSKAAGMSLDTL